jgi:hypothetical protein
MQQCAGGGVSHVEVSQVPTGSPFWKHWHVEGDPSVHVQVASNPTHAFAHSHPLAVSAHSKWQITLSVHAPTAVASASHSWN